MSTVASGFSRTLLASAAVAAACLTLSAQSPGRGVQDPAWSPDGKRLATSFVDRIWISGADGRKGRPLTSDALAVERDPAWSRDGRTIAFAADSGTGFDIYTAPSARGAAAAVTEMEGDERWPSWTPDGRIVFSHRAHPLARWRLMTVSAEGGTPAPLFGDADAPQQHEEREGRLSPDGTRIAYVSDREATDGDVDLWVAELPADERPRARHTRVTDARGREGFPSWSPDGSRLAFYAVREGAGAVWVAAIDPAEESSVRVRPASPDVLLSRRGGVPAWSPDGRRILCLQQGGTNRMAAFTVDGPREVTTVAEAAGSGFPQSWSPAGNLMAYTMNGRGTRSDIWVR
ncbi:MAG: TolB family protein, partial [Alphaproteobacteria bacterium]